MSGNKRQRGSGSRTEPTLGNLDQLDAAPPPAPPEDDLPRVEVEASPRRRPPARPKRPAGEDRDGGGSSHRGWLWPVLGVLLLALGTLAWLKQDALRSLLPRTELTSVLDRADQALAQGRLDGHDGTSARELYESARDQEPDNDRARDGLEQVGQAELGRARQFIADKHYDDAAQALATARGLLGGGDEVDAVARSLDAARNPPARTNGVIEKAQRAFAAGHLEGPDGAAALYRKALDADPDNAVARHGLDKIGDALAASARKALDAGDTAAAASAVDRLAALLPEDGDLPALRARLAQARKQSEDVIDAHLEKGEQALHAGHFTGDGDDTALAQFRAVLALDPDNARAKAGLGRVAQALLLRANAAMDSEDADQAAPLLDAAAALAPKSADLAAARSRLREMNEQADIDTQQPELTPDQQARVSRLVARAGAAEKAGDIMLPPGASAYDLYRQALSIDGNNPDAREGLQRLPALTVTLFDHALDAGRLQKADDLLSTLMELSPGDSNEIDLRHRLAGAWLDRAEKSADQGDNAGALHSLDAARRLEPNAPRLQELYGRVRGG